MKLKMFSSVDMAFSKYLSSIFFSKKVSLVTFSVSSFNYQELRLSEIKSTLEINNYLTLHYMLITYCARCEKRYYIKVQQTMRTTEYPPSGASDQ